ncbi:ankyrin repeat domain-containing protein [Paenibacillus sp. PR3]|uniref:Ankyrin repeat domain-containing protein n=1 Tax=Paenibacillus terricola TaxID=2763503 RepID=A0ABR8MU40_9BACL|nr:ankyrin repeat domain-containing protein [Paenibacillus terricola]MBD3919478.1 ankyrin repeat domain-containing protein [Paenibacillus terricola]
MEYNPKIDDVFDAIQTGTISTLQQLIETNASLANAESKDGLTPLGFAAHYGNIDAVQILINHNADVNAVSHSKLSFIPSNTALHSSLAGARNIDVIKLFLAHQAQTNIFDSNGHTCVHTAAFHDDNLDIIRLLVDHGADVNAKVEGGDSALALAVQQGNNRVVELLRQLGATM